MTDPRPKMETQWREVSAAKVIAHWMKDYERVPEHYDWWYDATKAVFVFRMVVPAKVTDEDAPHG